MSKLDRYLTSYVRRRRMVVLLRALFFAVSIGLLWMIIFRKYVLGDAVLMLVIIARPVRFLLKIPNAVAVAIEIEATQPAFDQKLITIVSQPVRSALTDHLQSEIELMIDHSKGKSLVKLRSLLAPLGIMIGMLALFILTDHR